MAKTTLRRRKANVYTIGLPPVPRYWALFGDQDLIACTYAADGAYISDRGTLNGAEVQPEGVVCIHTDSSATVADGSFAWVDENSVVHVWDVDGDTHYTHTPSASALASAPVFSAGWLYWWESPPSSDMSDETVMTLYKARADLATPTSLGTVTVSQPPPSSVDWSPLSAAMSGDRCIATWTWIDNAAYEVSGETTVYLDTDGSNPNVEYDVAMGGNYALPVDNEDLVGMTDSGRIATMTDADEDTLSHTWPTGTGWELNGIGDNFDANAGVTLLYGQFDPGGGDVGRVLEDSAETTTGSPDRSVDLQEHPTEEGFPTLVYLMEGIE